FLRRGQTPQAFEYQLIKQAHERAIRDGIENSTDDCALVLRLNHPVYTINGDEQNMKITYPLDLHIADKLFQLRSQTIQTYDREYLKHEFRDKVFVIIGGTSGIGESLTDILLECESRVYPLSRHTSPRIDITDEESIDNALSVIFGKEQRVGFIINCAGDLVRRNVEFMREEEWDHIYDLNIKGVFLLSRSALKYFKRQGFGYLMFVGSSSYTRGRAGYSAYSSSKAALVNFSQALAEEVYEYNIRVNVVSPGRVATPLRYRNFGKEDPRTLLSPKYVAERILMSLLVDTTGSVFEINGNEGALVK
ncbi:MAG: SDR family NAD(P)-dependent oxidoreductase, partial [Deltaproteobacteria bacterium]|nr:SDR family NAD(P)-dependent oxidoreductase [Deltaproteobacteria bacterium]MBW2027006.1 SDR family NAD(P)-dependent oxidoreductase [Deltaproteobacteria bacterium]